MITKRVLIIISAFRSVKKEVLTCWETFYDHVFNNLFFVAIKNIQRNTKIGFYFVRCFYEFPHAARRRFFTFSLQHARQYIQSDKKSTTLRLNVSLSFHHQQLFFFYLFIYIESYYPRRLCRRTKLEHFFFFFLTLASWRCLWTLWKWFFKFFF